MVLDGCDTDARAPLQGRKESSSNAVDDPHGHPVGPSAPRPRGRSGGRLALGGSEVEEGGTARGSRCCCHELGKKEKICSGLTDDGAAERGERRIQDSETNLS